MLSRIAMSEIGNDILTEYSSEIREKIEDDKNRTRFHQVICDAEMLWRCILISLNVTIGSIILALLAFVFLLDDSALNALRSSTNTEIINGLNSLLQFASIIATVSTFFLIVVKRHSLKRDLKEERKEREKERLDRMVVIVDVCEEILLRHKLIDKAEATNND
jgi:uncharacterized membrane protein